MRINNIKRLALCASAACLCNAYADTQPVIVHDKNGKELVFNVDTEYGYLKTTSSSLEIYENAQTSNEAKILEYSNIKKVVFNNNTTGSLNVVSGDNMSILPNPASDFVMIINHDGKEGNCEIYSISGQLICTKSISNKMIDVSNLVAGEYILKIGNKSFKLIKK